MRHVTAAGRSLTVRELREALTGLSGDTLVYAHGTTVTTAEACPTALDLDESLDLDGLLEFVRDVAHRTESPTLRKRALEIVGWWGVE